MIEQRFQFAERDNALLTKEIDREHERIAEICRRYLRSSKPPKP